MQFLREKKKEKEICFRNLENCREREKKKNTPSKMKRNYHDRDLKAQSPLLRAVVIYMLLQK